MFLRPSDLHYFLIYTFGGPFPAIWPFACGCDGVKLSLSCYIVGEFVAYGLWTEFVFCLWLFYRRLWDKLDGQGNYI